MVKLKQLIKLHGVECENGVQGISEFTAQHYLFQLGSFCTGNNKLKNVGDGDGDEVDGEYVKWLLKMLH